YRGDTELAGRLITIRTLHARHPRTGCYALHLAVIFNRIEVFKLLLKQPTLDTSLKDHLGRTAMHYAAASSGIEGDATIYHMMRETTQIEEEKNQSKQRCNGSIHGITFDDTVPDQEGFSADDVKMDPDLINMKRVRIANKFPVEMHTPLFSLEDLPIMEQKMLEGDENFIFFDDDDPNASEIKNVLSNLQNRVIAIWEALREGDNRTVKHLVDSKRMAMCREPGTGMTPLHAA
ncbi:hypothetical protein PMAYCL1PPCAC_13214, partial [Pristionchus mayeri]